MRRAQLLDGGYVEIIEKDGGWTYDYVPTTRTARDSDEVPDIYTSADEAQEVARHRFEAELITEFTEVE